MRYDKWKWGVEPFKPNHMIYQALALVPVLIVFFAIVVFVPQLFIFEGEPADPGDTPEHIKPEWYFLPAYQVLKATPKVFPPEVVGEWGEFIGVAVQLVFLLVLFLLPFIDRNPERHPARRPVVMTLGAIALLGLIALGVWGHYS